MTANAESSPGYEVIRQSEVRGDLYGQMYVRELFNGGADGVSIAVIKINGRNPRKVNDGGDVFYLVIQGEGEFDIDKRIKVSKGDLIRVRKGTAYADSGTMTLVAINLPGFNRDLERIIE